MLLLDLRSRIETSEKRMKEMDEEIDKWKNIASNNLSNAPSWLLAVLSRVEDIKRKEGVTAVDIVVLSAREYCKMRDLASMQRGFVSGRT
eukprot:gnl/Chilomastix_caulleri/5743.p2 GENE.gnl/Chilomastix_caulleri/5743~~gnl/Chilomastix_caulleri/5743.p2  ORF type:complete len:90 (-),score=27.08 gnl/Chilomastix_caulleri/5743:91-360(-)